MKPQNLVLLFCLFALIAGQTVIESNWDAHSPVVTQSHNENSATATSFGFSLWFQYNYRIPKRSDVSQLVNHQTAIAGVTEHTNYMIDENAGDRALSVHFREFGTAGGPVLRFSTYNLNGENVELDITLDVDEVDGAWNWIYFGYSHTEQKVVAAVKGESSDLKVKMASNVAHNEVLNLLFQVGTPQQGINTLNGHYFDPVMNVGDDAFLGTASQIEDHFENKEEHEQPQKSGCHRCGGTVMTPSYDFADMTNGYKVAWEKVENKETIFYDQPFEYAVFGWARSHQPISGSHILFRLTINNDAILGDQNMLGDRALMVTIDSNHIVGSTYSYDIQGQSLQKNVNNHIDVQGDETQWFFIYAGYSHRHHKVQFFIKFADREEAFQLQARHFYSNYHAMILGNDQWNQNFDGAMRDWHISFCEGAYRTDKFENLYRDDLVASVGFGQHEKDACNDRCATCETAAVEMCITCAANRSGAPYCLCNAGYYEDGTVCEPCRMECETCNNSETCMTCAGNRVKPEEGCPCPHMHYDIGEEICPPCSDACAECDLDGNCTVCRANAEPVPDCPCKSHHFANVHQGKEICEVCDVRCNDCSGVFYNCIDCASNTGRTGAPTCSCPSGYLDQCGENTYVYPLDNVNGNMNGSVVVGAEDRCEDGTCVPCASQCLTCSGAIDTCDVCAAGRVNPPECHCPDGQYADEQNVCRNCHVKCKTCSSYNQCIECADDSNRANPGDCPCNDGFYEAGNASCPPCHDKCATCSAFEQCITCANPRVNPPTCPCPEHMYDDAGVCTDCSYKCDGCNSTPANCEKCAANRVNAPTCHCPANYYDDGFSTECPECDCHCHTCDVNGCLTCSGLRIGAPECRCPDGMFHSASLTVGDAMCTHQVGSNDGTCEVCNYYCKTCNNADSCVTCVTNAFRMSPPDCPCQDGFYDNNEPVCRPCRNECQTCDNGEGCITCKPGRINPPECICPDGQYDDGYSCLPCADKCLTCHENAHNCVECAAERVASPPECPCHPGQFEIEGHCNECDYQCQECVNNSSNCTNCAENRLEKPYCYCPLGYYSVPEQALCPPCSYQCTNCVDSADNCTACAAGRINIPHCQCPDGSFDDGVAECKPCAFTCLTCVTAADNCIVCAQNRGPAAECPCPFESGYYEVQGQAYCPPCANKCATCSAYETCETCKEGSHRASPPHCPCVDGYFENGEKECKPCSVQCNTCTDMAEHCIVCSGNRINPPVCSCPEGTFDGGDAECPVCDEVCFTCHGSADNCTECAHGSPERNPPPECPIVPQGINSAEAVDVPVGSAIVIDCDCKCMTCSEVGNNCHTCDVNRANPPSCPCNDGYYEDGCSCGVCPYYCVTCSNASDCITCSGNRTTLPDCPCPAGTYDNGDAVCPPCGYRCTECTQDAHHCTTCSGIRTPAPDCPCPDPYYEETNGECETCSYRCNACTNHRDNCQVCSGNRINIPDCVCPSGTYDDGVNAECQPCAYNCSECSLEGCTICCGNRVDAPTCGCRPHYYDNGNCECPECHYKCDTCTAHESCIACAANRGDTAPNCPCPAGFYEDGTATCPPCSYQCATCNSLNDCITCSELRVSAPSCHCMDGYYEAEHICKPCSYKCVTCHDFNTCITCQDGRIEAPYCNCPVGKYDNGQQDPQCYDCDPKCISCSGAADHCTTCAGNRTSPSECPCPLHTLEQNTANCPDCDPQCAACENAVSHCTICAGIRVNTPNCPCPNHYYAQSDFTCKQCDYWCGNCINSSDNCTTCPENSHRSELPCNCNLNYYDAGVATCSPCSPKCVGCTGSADNCIDCQWPRENAPHCKCPSGSFDDGTGECKVCSYKCETCEEKAENCVVCAANRIDTPNCHCQATFFDIAGEPECVRCSDKCNSCTSCGSCTTCHAPRVNAPQCDCPHGMMESCGSETNILCDQECPQPTCIDCNYKCADCVDSTSNCVYCAGNRVSAPECTCPEGTYDTGAKVCPHCHSKCATCEENAENCITCAEGRINPPTCECPYGSYDNGETCKPCHFHCASCTAEHTCIDCAGNRIDAPVCDCPAHTYDNGTPTCPACQDKCDTCVNMPDNCITCAEGRIHPPECYVPEPTAQSAEIEDVPVGSAKPIDCDCRCETCERSGANCITCDTNRVNAPTCGCASGYYEDSNCTCQDCPYACLTCTSFTNCDVCEDPAHRVPTECKCIDGYFDAGVPNCHVCAIQCLTCTEHKDNCITCHPSRINNAPSCDCPDGTTVDEQGICQNCKYPCSKCSGEIDSCTECADIREQIPDCGCPAAFYDDGYNAECKPCQTICLTCENGNECTSCKAHRAQEPPVCPCEKGYFDCHNNGECCACEVQCNTCEGSSSNCITCAPERRNTPPQCPCKDDHTEINHVCEPCNAKRCETCSEHVDNCVICKANRVNNPPDCPCQPGYYENEEQDCIACHAYCATCESQAQNCLTCNGIRVEAPACVCPTGHFEDEYGICQPCAPKCAECITNKYHCTLCADERVAGTEHQCPCPEGEFEKNDHCSVCSYRCATCERDLDNCLSCSHGTRGPTTECHCMTGYYNNGTEAECPPCAVQCHACVDNADNCTVCASTRVQNSEPACPCDHGQYDDNGICKPCGYRCDTCAEAEHTCLSCAANRTPASECPCPTGFYDDGIHSECYACASKCQTCENNANNCTICAADRVQEAPGCPCVAGQVEISGECKVCDWHCLECSNSQRHCTICAANRIEDPTCICPDATYEVEGQGACPSCEPQCAKCKDAPHNCLECANGHVSPPECPIEPAAGKSAKVTDIPVGSVQVINCRNCCETCSRDKDHCEVCSANRANPPHCGCIPGYFQPQSEDMCDECQACGYRCITCESEHYCNECADSRINAPECSCPAGMYDDGASVDCQVCPGHCDTCHMNSAGNVVCDTCSEGRVGAPTCNCADGTWDNNGVCELCGYPCTTCSDKWTCTECADVRASVPECPCPQGYYDQEGVAPCNPCSFRCAVCERDHDNCTECADSRIGLPYCSDCPEGFFDDGIHVDCQQCSAHYYKCVECDADNCLHCEPHRVAPFCECQQGFVEVNGVCVACHYQCKTCSGSQSNCLTCAGNDRVNPPTCSCPDGYYDDGTEDINCHVCAEKCKTCAGTNYNCTECALHRVNAPHCTCMDGMVEQGTICVACDYPCKTCSITPDNCDECIEGRESTPECTCPFGQYENANNRNCEQCNFPCESCSSAAVCTVCRGNRVGEPECTCPLGYFETYENLCPRCSYKCVTCEHSKDNCTQCAENRVHEPVCNCPQGYYHIDESAHCPACHQKCKSCVSASDNCVTCAEGLVSPPHCVTPPDVPKSIKVERIPVGSAQVVVCERQCATCEEHGNNCIVCAANRVEAPTCPCKYHWFDNMVDCEECAYQCTTCVYNGETYQTAPGAHCTGCASNRVNLPFCVCPKGYYDDAVPDCKQCRAPCAACDNYSVCTECKSGYFLHNDDCIAECPVGFWGDINDRKCKPCHETCHTCAKGDSDSCTACAAPRFLHEGKCLESCPSTFFAEEACRCCKPCQQPCETCYAASNGSCNTCVEGWYFLQNHCISPCPEGYWENYNSRTCDPCDHSCKTCHYQGGASDCDSCDAPHYLFEGTCSHPCPDGYYGIEETRTCEACHSTCATCSTFECCASCPSGYFLNGCSCVAPCPMGLYGNSATGACEGCKDTCRSCANADECTSCYSPLFLHQNQCIEPCPSGMYGNTADQTCRMCHETCLTCEGGMDSQCRSCDSTRYLSTSPVGFCLVSCPVGQYGHKVDRECRDCYDGCASCQQSCNADLTECHVTCLQCEHPKYLDANNDCVGQCPAGYYHSDSPIRTCQQCQHPCETCNNEHFCTICAQGYLMVEDGTCVDPCPLGWVKDESSMTCVQCHESCRSCHGTGEDQCDTCQLPRYLSGHYCTYECPEGAYEKDTCSCSPDNDCGCCKGCHAHCQSCFGASNNECHYCNSGFYGQPNAVETCLPSCPENYFKNDNTRTCQQCAHPCWTCNGATDHHCTSCQIPYSLFQNQCVEPCPTHFYAGANQTCEPCHGTCASCHAGSATDCLTCPEGTYLSDEGRCIGECPEGQYENEATNECDNCHSTCAECTGPNNHQCIRCNEPRYLQDGYCVDPCTASGHYPNDEDRECKPCHQSCAECTCGGAGCCVVCPADTYLHNGYCVYPCPDGWFESADGNCGICHSTCADCYGPAADNCTMCPEGSYLFNNSCISPCWAGYWGNDETRTCDPCHDTCATCTAGEFHQCETCDSPNFLLIDANDASHRTCTHPCPYGYYGDEYLRQCVACSLENCLNCTTADHCIECQSPSFLWQGTCIYPCPSTHYGNTESGKCEQCHASCATCNGPHDDNCLSCATGSYYHQGKCVKPCPEGFFEDDNTNTCVACHGNCLTCIGPHEYDCTCCSTESRLHYGECVSPCPEGYYATSGACNEVCHTCHATCQSCTGGSYNDCTYCPPGRYLHYGQCIEVCPSGYYAKEDNRTCVACDSTCATCYNGSQNGCLTCDSPRYFHNNSCVAPCPEGTYSTVNPRQCNNCHDSCKTCSGGDDNDCTTCYANKYLHQGRCVAPCPSGTYANENTKTCENCSNPCATCATSSTHCVSCVEAHFLHLNTCVNPCPLGYYGHQESRECRACDPSCATCHAGSGSAAGECSICNDSNDCAHGQFCCPSQGRCSYPETICDGDNVYQSGVKNCDSCYDPYFLNGSICQETCPCGTWGNTQTHACELCDNHCKCCSGAAENQCTSCHTGHYLHNGECVHPCPNGYYADATTMHCELCNGNCLTCNGPDANNCTTCRDTHYLYLNQCWNPCPEGTYEHDTSMTCRNCHARCSECQDDTYRQCQACNYPYVLMDTSCLQCAECAAQQGYYCNHTDNHCSPCNHNCLNCTDSADNCTECYPPRINAPSCQCPDGYYDNGNTCVGCAYNCATCENREECLTCNDIRENAPACECPAGYYDSGETECQLCKTECETCDRDNICTSCVNPGMRTPPNCECPPGWQDANNGVDCAEEPHPEGLDDLIPSNPSYDTPAAQVDIDVSELADDYEIGFGFYYRYMFRLPERVELDLARENWLGIAGVSENGDYGTFANAGDRCLSVFQWPWSSNGMQVQFGSYDVATGDNNLHKSMKIADKFHQQWHYVYFSYSHAQKTAVAAIKPTIGSQWIIKEFEGIHHKNVEEIQALSFFLGSSNPSQFSGINGYFFNARIYTQGAYKGSVSDLNSYYSSIVSPPSLVPGHKVWNVAPGETSDYQVQDCHTNAYAMGDLDFTDSESAFAESYAVWGWAKFDNTCKQELFRFVIDTPEEVNNFSYNSAALGNNVLVATVDNMKVHIHTYTFGIQDDVQDHTVMMNVDFTQAADGDWFFFYAAYSFEEKKASAYVWSADQEYRASAEANHMIPKFVGAYIGANYEGAIRDPTVCVSGSEDCVFEDFNEIMSAKYEAIDEQGYIPAHGPNPQVEVEVPENQVGDISEYGFGLWFRFQYRIPERLDINVARNSFLALAGISENGDWTQSQECGDRSLAVYYVKQEAVSKPTYRFSTYNLEGDKPNVYNQVSLPFEDFEGSWYYIYSSYSAATKNAVSYVHLHGSDNSIYEVRMENKKHHDAISSLYFSLGASSGYSVNGLYAGLTFNYQTGAHLNSQEEFWGYFNGKVSAPPAISAPSKDHAIVHYKEVSFTGHNIPKVEHHEEFAHQGDYSVYGWYKWDPSIEQLPKHLAFRLTINEPSYQQDASLLGDRTLMVQLNSEGHFTFSTYNFKFGYGHDNVDSYKGIEYGDDLADWYWIYFGYSRAKRQAVAYMRFRDREIIEFFDDHQHFIPKYFGLNIGNSQLAANGWNGAIKDLHLCLGQGCAREDNFEELNCADQIEYADPEDPLSLGPAMPGCESEGCENGMYPPCGPEEEEAYSATVDMEWPEISTSDLIPQPYNKGSPSAQIEVHESYLPYVTEYSFGFWYQFRFRSPVRMEVDQKRSGRHAVAGVTENESYCHGQNLGDRALSLFFEPWESTSKPTYSFCTYDVERDEASICESVNFKHTNVDGYWFYVYSGYSTEEGRTYSAFVGEQNYKAVNIPKVHHNAPPSKLQFNLGATHGFDAINGYFYHVQFDYTEGSFIGTEAGVRQHLEAIPRPDFFQVPQTGNQVVGEIAQFTRWGPVNKMEWDGEYDGAFQWATYGWARIEGQQQQWNELFRLTINQEPVGDAEFLGDRSLTAFVLNENNVQKIYFAAYNYGYTSDKDDTTAHMEIEVTGELTEWFYIYMGYSVERRTAAIYLKLQSREVTHTMDSFQFVPRYFGLYIARSEHEQYAGFQGDIQQWFFMAGDGSFIKPETIDCEVLGTCEPEEEGEECVVLYADCDYKGMSTRICDDTPFTDIDYEVKSITVPTDKHIYLYNMPCFNGLDVEITHDQACMEQIDFSLIELHGVRLLEENAFLNAASNTLHAKYRRTNLRKAGGMKAYQRE